MSNTWSDEVNRRVKQAGTLARTYTDEGSGESYQFSVQNVIPLAWGINPTQLDYRMRVGFKISKEGKIVGDDFVDFGSVLIMSFMGLFTKQGWTNSRQDIYAHRYFNDTLHDISEIIGDSWREGKWLSTLKSAQKETLEEFCYEI